MLSFAGQEWSIMRARIAGMIPISYAIIQWGMIKHAMRIYAVFTLTK
jgi:hypothetical protein